MRQALSKQQQGAVVVELILVLPVLLVLWVTVIDLGLLLRDYQILQNAAREGARFSAQPSNWLDPRNPKGTIDAIEDRVVRYCSEEHVYVSRSDVSLDQDFIVTIGDRAVKASRVTVQYSHRLLIPMPVPGFPIGRDITLTGSAVFRNMY